MDPVTGILIVLAILLFLRGSKDTAEMVQSPVIPTPEKAGCGTGIAVMVGLAFLLLLAMGGLGEEVLSGMDATNDALRGAATGISDFRQQQFGDYPIP